MDFSKQGFEEGLVLLIDKPMEWTSFDVVRKVRNLAGIKKVGHAGTLDPLATGLLILCTGRMTRRINEYMAREKEYTGTIFLGATTPTFDLESEPQDVRTAEGLSESEIHAMATKFTGELMQVPPAHSAIKQQGKRVYELARAGREVRLEPRKIFIMEFEITGIALPEVDFRVVCSTGTYIRSLAHDFGRELGVGGYLAGLCRTRIGEFHLRHAMSIAQFEAEVKAQRMKG
ncbi:MAG TPA: tRNA pseudouridine(55) synthase TruB [Chitinophagaceae bacterium]|nr:tRNA pseudouridine(55) synthase TruB [Chitinophagaceae bacterium]